MSDGTGSLTTLLPPEHRVAELGGLSADRVIADLLKLLSGAGADFASVAITAMRDAILAREREATTGIGNRVAVPHMKQCPFVDRIWVAFGRSREGLDWQATDAAQVHLFFMVLTPAGFESEHVRVMKKIVRLSRDKKTMDYLIAADSFANFDAILREVDAEDS